MKTVGCTDRIGVEAGHCKHLFDKILNAKVLLALTIQQHP